MSVPYTIVKGKACLVAVVHKKTVAVVALQEVKSEDQREVATLVSASKANLSLINMKSKVVNGAGVSVVTSPLRSCANARTLLVKMPMLRVAASLGKL
ncbi:hypothetical protein HHX47_DHR8000214 [Lentinula edodes]|nr:hypothetical protein HHX47_DHR8000214 [Lentinula edodes]